MYTDISTYNMLPYCNIKSIFNYLIMSNDNYTDYTNNTLWKILTDRDYKIMIYYIYCIHNNLSIKSKYTSIPSYYTMLSRNYTNYDENNNDDENNDNNYNDDDNNYNNYDNNDNKDNDKDNVKDNENGYTSDLNFREIYKFMHENDSNKIFLHKLYLSGRLIDKDLKLLN